MPYFNHEYEASNKKFSHPKFYLVNSTVAKESLKLLYSMKNSLLCWHFRQLISMEEYSKSFKIRDLILNLKLIRGLTYFQNSS